MKLYSDIEGILIYVDFDDVGDVPKAYSNFLDVDADTNVALVYDLHLSTDLYRLINGVLTKSGQSVTIQPDSTARSDLKQLATIRDGLKTYYNSSNPNNAQTALAVKGIIRVLGIMLDIYLKR